MMLDTELCPSTPAFHPSGCCSSCHPLLPVLLANALSDEPTHPAAYLHPLLMCNGAQDAGDGFVDQDGRDQFLVRAQEAQGEEAGAGADQGDHSPGQPNGRVAGTSRAIFIRGMCNRFGMGAVGAGGSLGSFWNQQYYAKISNYAVQLFFECCCIVGCAFGAHI